ncbi:MAG: DNRLRE domain-containing protein, partial [Candidatus Poseidoniaceae archaeon]
MPYASEKRRALTAIFIVFLFIFSEMLVLDNNNYVELEENTNSRSIVSYSVNSNVYISSGLPNDNFGSSNDNYIGIDAQENEYRSLYRFTNNLSSNNDLIISASLTLTCDVVSQNLPGQIPTLYAARVNANFDASDVTWNEITDSISWQIAGVKGDQDRDDWDIPAVNTIINTNTYSYELNVTKQVQTALDLGRNKFDFVLSALGGQINCAKSNNATSSFHPELVILRSQGVHGDGGFVQQNFASNGLALMKSDFILAADTNPRISFNNLNGSGAQFQFSQSSDFRNYTDLHWLYSTTDNQFLVTGTSGYYDMPTSESFPLGSAIYYRVRSIDNTSKLSEWTDGHFLLPEYNVVNNNDGTATISLNQSEFNLSGHKLIEDTYIDSAATQAQGQAAYLFVSNDANQNKLSLLKLNLNLLGIHANATINSGSLDLHRITVTSNGPTISLHPLEHSLWFEDEATWNYGRVGQLWNNGGLEEIGASEVTNIDSNAASDSFSFDIQNSVQEHVETFDPSPLSYSLTGTVPGDSNPSLLEEIKFASSDHLGTDGNGPRLNITYSWTNNQTSPDVEIISPIDSEPVWDVVDDNITGDTTPTLEWQSSNGNIMQYILQLSSDEYFRNILLDYDSRNNIPTTGLISENYTFSTADQLGKGQPYYWRVKLIDSDDRAGVWQYSSFFISTLESEWLGGDMFRFVINNSIDQDIESAPGFRYSSISGNSPNSNSYGYPYLYVANSYNALLGIGLQNYQLPDGFAVTSSNLDLSVSSSSGSPFEVGIWELTENNWSEQEVTWLESSNGVPWNSPGASSTSDRVSMLTNFSVTSSCCSQLNVTSAVQNAMREGSGVSFLFELMPTAPSSSNVLFNSPLNQNLQLQPQLEIIFTLGSDQKPIPPSPLSPSNGEWIYKNNSTLESVSIDNLTWSHNNPMPVIGWALEIDSTETFNSIDKRSISSWNDVGFDVNQCVYELQTPLDVGKQWYWRVRGLSNSYQLGDWSQGFTFYQPDFNYNRVSSDTFTTEYNQGSVFSNNDMPYFVDTSITDSNLIVSGSTISDTVLDVGRLADGTNSSILISIPITQDMVPENATVLSAKFSMEHYSTSTSSIRLGIREVLVPWDDSATNFQYNSTSSWSQLGGRDVGVDISRPFDIIMSQSGNNEWDITELAQASIAEGQTSLSLMIYSDSSQFGDVARFYSSDNPDFKPRINLTWVEGQRSIASDAAETLTPVNGLIYFNQSSHAVIPETRPDFSWALPTASTVNADAWRIFFLLDAENDMEGELMFDSRTDSHLFDLAALSFSPDQDIDFNTEINWGVQPIESGVYGTRSNFSTYFIPVQMGQELSQNSASLIIQDGSMYPQSNYPSATTDIYLDEGSPYQGYDSAGLRIGNSSIMNMNRSASTSILSFNLSNLNLPSVYEITSAELKLTALSGSGDVEISASRMLTEWDENSTWENASTGQPWLNSGALRGADSDLPDSMIFIDSLGEHTWNVTRILQLTTYSNSDTASILLQPEIINSTGGGIDGNY